MDMEHAFMAPSVWVFIPYYNLGSQVFSQTKEAEFARAICYSKPIIWSYEGKYSSKLHEIQKNINLLNVE